MGKLNGTATETIPFGALVLCRNFEVSLADTAVANGVAAPRPLYGYGKPEYRRGEFVRVDPVQGLGGRDLHALAAGPIMDPNEIYLPAGRISLAEAKAREAQQVLP